MNLDALAEDLRARYRRIHVTTRYGCPDDGGVINIRVSEGTRRWSIWREGDDIVVREEPFPTVEGHRATFADGSSRDDVLEHLARRRTG